MGKRVIVVIVAILILGAIAFGLTRNNNKTSTGQTNTPASNSQSSQDNQSQNSTQAPTSTDTVTIQNFAFLPGDITVKKGTSVTWTNKDSTTHTVSEMDNQQGPKSGDLAPGDKYSYTFNNTGTYKYRCDLHPYMLGTVTVTD